MTKDDTRQALREAIRRVRETLPFFIEAWVLLPDHMHCIWRLPANDNDFSKRWSMIKRYTSQAVIASHPISGRRSSEVRRRESGLWQRRFWEHMIRDDEDFRRHMDYVHWNPVKHGLVPKISHWPYSSFHRYVKQGVYPEDWGGCGDINDDKSFGE